MALKKRGKYWYGDSQFDLRGEMKRFSAGGYAVSHGAEAVCRCGGRQFRLTLDENEGCAVRTCVACKHEHAIGDSADFMDEAELEERECICERDVFEITVGVSLYADSRAVRWLYLGCRCVACGCLGVYGDWKNEYDDYDKLLALV